MKKNKKYKTKIKDIEWEFILQTSSAYTRMHGKDSSAITYLNERKVYFNVNGLIPAHVRHELMHVYVASSGTNSSGLNADQIEELCAEIYGDHGPRMDLLVDTIMEEFSK